VIYRFLFKKQNNYFATALRRRAIELASYTTKAQMSEQDALLQHGGRELQSISGQEKPVVQEDERDQAEQRGCPLWKWLCDFLSTTHFFFEWFAKAVIATLLLVLVLAVPPTPVTVVSKTLLSNASFFLYGNLGATDCFNCSCKRTGAVVPQKCTPRDPTNTTLAVWSCYIADKARLLANGNLYISLGDTPVAQICIDYQFLAADTYPFGDLGIQMVNIDHTNYVSEHFTETIRSLDATFVGTATYLDLYVRARYNIVLTQEIVVEESHADLYLEIAALFFLTIWIVGAIVHKREKIQHLFRCCRYCRRGGEYAPLPSGQKDLRESIELLREELKQLQQEIKALRHMGQPVNQHFEANFTAL
jgi:hypothetical protein